MIKLEELLSSKEDNIDSIIKHLGYTLSDEEYFNYFKDNAEKLKDFYQRFGINNFDEFMLFEKKYGKDNEIFLKAVKEFFIDTGKITIEQALRNFPIMKMYLNDIKRKNIKLPKKDLDIIEKYRENIEQEMDNNYLAKSKVLKDFIILQKKLSHEKSKNVVFDKYKNKLANENKIDACISTLIESLDIASNKNSRDIEAIKSIQRYFKKLTLENPNTPILKDTILIQSKKIADEKNISKKKIIDFVNEIYGNNNKITYSSFISNLKKYDIKQDDPVFVDGSEDRYQHTQRFMRSDNNKTFVVLKEGSPIADILNKYYNEFPEVVKKINFLTGHFGDALAFARTTKVADNWVHIDAIQTDFFNAVRKIGSENKEAKELITEILGKEESSYKAAISKVKEVYKNAKVWTMNTPEMATKAENIQSADKLSSLYSLLPPKLGFKKISFEKLSKIVEARSYSKGMDSWEFRSLLKSSKKISLTKKEINDIVAAILEFAKETNKKNKIMAQGYFDDELAKKIKNVLFEKDDIATNIAHLINVNFLVIKKMKDTDRRYLQYLDPISVSEIKEEIEKFIVRKNERSIENYIWWANRDMLNEDTLNFTKIIQEYLRS